MKIFENKKLQEKYYLEILDNGLKVYLMPKNEFHKTYAIFLLNMVHVILNLFHLVKRII